MNRPPAQPKLIVINGPTAVGKTAVAIQLAQQLKTEIISADSRQFYRELSIGTAKPHPDELAAAKHHFIGSLPITQNYSVGDYEKEGLAVLDHIFKDHDNAILVGGSGLYIKAIGEGFDDLPVASPETRARLNKEFNEHEITYLQKKLRAVDPVYYATVDLNNPQRLVRALEVFETTGRPFSSYRKAEANKRPFQCIQIGLELPRDLLYQRINDRVDKMIEEGLVEEVRSLLPHRHLNALNTVGYSELFDYIDGKTDLRTAIDLIKQNTRRFAKRQLTWFRKEKEIKWFMADNPDLIDLILRELCY